MSLRIADIEYNCTFPSRNNEPKSRSVSQNLNRTWELAPNPTPIAILIASLFLTVTVGLAAALREEGWR